MITTYNDRFKTSVATLYREIANQSYFQSFIDA